MGFDLAFITASIDIPYVAGGPRGLVFAVGGPLPRGAGGPLGARGAGGPLGGQGARGFALPACAAGGLLTGVIVGIFTLAYGLGSRTASDTLLLFEVDLRLALPIALDIKLEILLPALDDR